MKLYSMMEMPVCGPVIVYAAFSTTQILVDLYRGLYGTSFVKILVTIILSLTLQVLCEMDLSLIAWMIVFIPFITMTIFTALLLFVFGSSAVTGEKPSFSTPKSQNNDETVVTPTGINQPYAQGKSVEPGVYNSDSPVQLTPTSTNQFGTVFMPSETKAVESFSSVAGTEDKWLSSLSKHMNKRKYLAKLEDQVNHSEASIPIRNAS